MTTENRDDPSIDAGPALTTRRRRLYEAAQAGSVTAIEELDRQSSTTQGDRNAVEDVHRSLAQGLGLPIAEEMPPAERKAGVRAVSRSHGLGAWEVLQPGAEPTFMLAGVGRRDEGRLSPCAWPGSSGRAAAAPAMDLAAARAWAEDLRLPFTPDMTLGEVADGTRAVDALGRVGTFRSVAPAREGEPGASKLVFVEDPGTPTSTALGDEDAGGPERAQDAPAGWRAEDEVEASRAGGRGAQGVAPNMPDARGRTLGDPDYEPDPGPTYFRRPVWPRNGREAGAWAAGLALVHGVLRVELPKDDVAGAVTSLVDAGMTVGRFSSRSDEAGDWVTLDVSCPPGLGDDGRPPVMDDAEWGATC